MMKPAIAYLGVSLLTLVCVGDFVASAAESKAKPAAKAPSTPKAAVLAHIPLDISHFDDVENKQKHRAGLISAARWVLNDPYCVEATSGYWDSLRASDENPTKVPGDYYVITCRVSDLATRQLCLTSFLSQVTQ